MCQTSQNRGRGSTSAADQTSTTTTFSKSDMESEKRSAEGGGSCFLPGTLLSEQAELREKIKMDAPSNIVDIFNRCTKSMETIVVPGVEWLSLLVWNPEGEETLQVQGSWLSKAFLRENCDFKERFLEYIRRFKCKAVSSSPIETKDDNQITSDKTKQLSTLETENSFVELRNVYSANDNILMPKKDQRGIYDLDTDDSDESDCISGDFRPSDDLRSTIEEDNNTGLQMKSEMAAVNGNAMQGRKSNEPCSVFPCSSTMECTDSVDAAKDKMSLRSSDKQELTTSGKLFACDKCNKKYKYKDSLIRHNKTHTRFVASSQKFRHKQAHNKEEVKNDGCDYPPVELEEGRTRNRLENIVKSKILSGTKDGAKVCQVTPLKAEECETLQEKDDQGTASKQQLPHKELKEEIEEETGIKEPINVRLTPQEDIEELKGEEQLEVSDYQPDLGERVDELVVELKEQETMESKLNSDKKVFFCNVCGSSFKQRHHLKQHSYLHTGETPYQCRHCPEKFVSTTRRFRHEKIHREPKGANKLEEDNADKLDLSKRPFKCTTCSKSFKHKRHLKEHNYNHTGETPYQCRYCPEKFVSATNRLRHEKKKHKEPKDTNTPETRFTCNDCGKSYKNQKHLKEHSYIHTDETPYKCRYCPKRFSVLSERLKHENIGHNEIRTSVNVTSTFKYCCEICLQKFSTKKKLISHHNKTHSEYKPYNCVACPKTFCTLSGLNRHTLKHAGKKLPRPDKTFLCETCGKSRYYFIY